MHIKLISLQHSTLFISNVTNMSESQLVFPWNKEDLSVRQALPEDYATIVSIDPDIYRGIDYLPFHLQEYSKDSNRIMWLYMIHQKVVSFCNSENY